MVDQKTLGERGLLKQFIFPFVLAILVFLFLFFETEILGFLGISPFNHVVLLLVLGFVLLTKGSILSLRSGMRDILNPNETISKKNELNENSSLVAFVWIMQGFVLSMVALFYEIINQTHVVLFGSAFSWLIVLLVIWEIVMILSTVRKFRKLKLI